MTLEQKSPKAIYIGRVQILPTPPFTPWPNTLGYRPLKSNLNDYSGNHFDLTLNTWASVSYNSSTNMAEITGQVGYYAWALLPRSWDFTIWFWCYPSSWNSIGDKDSWWPLWYMCNMPWDYKWNFAIGSYKRLGSTTTVAWPCHIMITRSGSLFTLYINWQVDATMTQSGAISSNSYAFYIDNWQNWISDVIMEGIARTATEVTDYYNNSKSEYGL